MSPEKLPTSPEVSNSLTPLATTEAQKLQESFRVSITKERNLTTYLGYLTALQQLPGASLDALFDGEVELGEEELFTVYGIISMFNGNNSFTHNKPPKKISYDRNWALDSTFDLQYETLSDKNTGKSVSYIKSIGGSTSLIPSAFGDTQLVFVYDSTTRQLKGMEFKKPIQRVNESIIPHRNGA